MFVFCLPQAALRKKEYVNIEGAAESGSEGDSVSSEGDVIHVVARVM
jgi:hypothetical protein